MNKIFLLLSLVLSTSAFGQGILCTFCENESIKRTPEEFESKCVHRDTIIVNDSIYEIRRLFICNKRVIKMRYKKSDHRDILLFTVYNETDTIFVPDKPAEFVGGQEAFNRYIKKKFSYSIEAVEKRGVTGKVIVLFTIDETGKVKDAKIHKSLEPSLDEAVLKFAQTMPDWIPAEKDGKPVSSKHIMPIKFSAPSK